MVWLRSQTFTTFLDLFRNLFAVSHRTGLWLKELTPSANNNKSFICSAHFMNENDLLPQKETGLVNGRAKKVVDMEIRTLQMGKSVAHLRERAQNCLNFMQFFGNFGNIVC